MTGVFQSDEGVASLDTRNLNASYQICLPLPTCPQSSQPVSLPPHDQLLVVLASGVLGQVVTSETTERVSRAVLS